MIQKIKERFSEVHIWYLVAVLAIGIALSIMIPLGHECDGVMHFYRSCDVSYGNILDPFVIIGHTPEYESVPAGFDSFGYYDFASRKIGVKEYYAMLSASDFSDGKADYYDPRTYASLFYYPQAIGIFIARTAHMSVRAAVILGHLMNLLAYSVITMFAVKIVPICKHFFAACCMCPLSIYLAASLSSDALLNALCFLFIALVLRYALDDEIVDVGFGQMFLLGILLLIIYMNKYVYVVLGILVFLIPITKFYDASTYRKIFAISLVPLVLFVLFQLFSGTFMPKANLADINGYAIESLPQPAPEYAGLTGIQFAVKYPGRFLLVLWRTFYEGLSVQFIYFNTFGPLNVYLEPAIYVVPIVLLIILAMDDGRYEKLISGKLRTLLIVASVLEFIAVVSCIYLLDVTANAPGDKVAGGIQARYFITAIAMMGIGIRPRRLYSQVRHVKEITIAAMTVLGVWSVVLYGVQLGRF